MAKSSSRTAIIHGKDGNGLSCNGLDWLKDHLDDSKVRIFEVSVDPRVYENSHIPGATNFNWRTDLVDAVNRDIASRDKLQDQLRKVGFEKDTTVIIYGDDNNSFAAWGYGCSTSTVSANA